MHCLCVDATREADSTLRTYQKLQLKPRSKPLDVSEPISTSFIFGGAKPIDKSAREREIEAKLSKSQYHAQDHDWR